MSHWATVKEFIAGVMGALAIWALLLALLLSIGNWWKDQK